MNDLSLPSPVARARDLARLIAAEADAIERGRRLTEPVVDELHGARLFRMLYPRSVGGDEVEPAVYIEAVGEWRGPTARSAGARRSPTAPASSRPISTWTRRAPSSGRRVRPAPGGRPTSAAGSRCRAAIGSPAAGISPAVAGMRAGWARTARSSSPTGRCGCNNFGRPTLRTWLFPVEQARLLDNWNPIGLRGTASESYTVEDLFVPEEFTGTREDPTLRREPGPLYAFPQQTLYSVGIACVALGIARGMLDAFIDLALRKTPRGAGRLADNAVIQAEVARAEARLGAARCYLIDTVTEIYRRAGPSAPIDIPDRARARLAGSNAITSAVAVANRTYKAAGVDAIFPGSPFERRFRDIHTLSQQIQSRDAHYETVGQVLLGNPPEVFL